MRGYFGVGVEGISKPANAGALMRTTHAFGGSFFFALSPTFDFSEARLSDTSSSPDHVATYVFPSICTLILPEGCALIGVEITEDAVSLPSFRHPLRAAYLLGPERGVLSQDAIARCDHIVQIPMKFCVNVSVAGALVMYDRSISMGRHAPRPVQPGGPTEALPKPTFGPPVLRSSQKTVKQL